MKPDLSIKPDEIDWRVGATFDRNSAKWGMLLGYIDSRLAMEKLDLLDPAWSTRMEPVTLNGESGVRCTLTVNGVSREDVGTASQTEPLKGAFSDALKRAAVHFGIGRELYDLPHIAVECNVGANGKVKSPKALPTWNGTRWTIDSNLGWVKYDQAPIQQPARSAPAPASTARERLLAAASAHAVKPQRLEELAKQIRVPAGVKASEQQIEQIIALIEAPIDADLQRPPAVVEPSRPEPGEGNAPPAVSNDPILDAVLAQTGGTVIPEKPGTDAYRAMSPEDRAQARGYWAKAEQAGARETEEPAVVGLGLDA